MLNYNNIIIDVSKEWLHVQPYPDRMLTTIYIDDKKLPFQFNSFKHHHFLLASSDDMTVRTLYCT